MTVDPYELLGGIIAITIITIITLFFLLVSEKQDNDRIYRTLSQRCEAPAYLDRQTLSCVVTYQIGE
jgi:hypothetical protein